MDLRDKTILILGGAGASRSGVERGSMSDHEYVDLTGSIRPGRLGAWIFRNEDRGERIKR